MRILKNICYRYINGLKEKGLSKIDSCRNAEKVANQFFKEKLKEAGYYE